MKLLINGLKHSKTPTSVFEKKPILVPTTINSSNKTSTNCKTNSTLEPLLAHHFTFSIEDHLNGKYFLYYTNKPDALKIWVCLDFDSISEVNQDLFPVFLTSMMSLHS